MAEDAARTAPVSVVIPGRNEAETITRVIKRVAELPHVGEVLVVDNASTDTTAEVARAAGARVVSEARLGMGYAVRTGFVAARHDWVMKVDADLDRFDVARFADMCAARRAGIGLVKGNWTDPNDDKPMTRLLVIPAVARLAPGLDGMASVNSGIYLANRQCFAAAELVGSYAVDLDVMLRVYAHGAGICEVDIGTLEHDRRSVGHYSGMARELSDFFFDRAAQEPLQEWLVLAGDRPLSEAMCAFLTARARIGGRVSVATESHAPSGLEALEKLAAFPTVRLLQDGPEAYQITPSATQLYIALPEAAAPELHAHAQALAKAAPVATTRVEMLEGGEDQSFGLVVPDGAARVAMRFRRL